MISDRDDTSTTPSCSDAHVLEIKADCYSTSTGTAPMFDIGTFWTKLALIVVFAGAVSAFGLAEASAEQPDLMVPVDGFLTDTDGVPVDSRVDVTFSLYSHADAEDPFWSTTRQLNVEEGSFSVYLGGEQPLSADDFDDNRSPYVALQIEDDDEMDRWPIGHVPYAAVARRADDASTVQGMEPGELMTGSTAGDVDYNDADNTLEADSSQGAIDQLANRVESLEQQLADAESDIDDLDDTVADHGQQMTAIDGELDAHDSRMTSLEDDLDDVGDVGDRVTDLEDTTAPMTRMDVDGDDSIVFEDVNLHVRSGQGSTDATPNGLGNLIVGYDEGSSSDKSGSHNIVYGSDAEYTSYGGLVGGTNNTVSAPNASVVGGTSNTASGDGAVVTSGSSNEASGNYTAVGAGHSNEAQANYSTVVAGWNNDADGSYSAVVAGSSNETQGLDSVVVGGSSNTADGSQEVVVD